MLRKGQTHIHACMCKLPFAIYKSSSFNNACKVIMWSRLIYNKKSHEYVPTKDKSDLNMINRVC